MLSAGAGFVSYSLCVCYARSNVLSLFLGMATYNQLPVFWSSWLQFPVQYDFSVSFSVSSLTLFGTFHTFCFTGETVQSVRDGQFKLYTKMVPIHTSGVTQCDMHSHSNHCHKCAWRVSLWGMMNSVKCFWQDFCVVFLNCWLSGTDTVVCSRRALSEDARLTSSSCSSLVGF